MHELIFATNNQNKVNEIRSALPPHFTITSLKEAGILVDIPEPHATLEANALEKSMTIYKLTGQDCFSEDTGLEVTVLHGEPGVRSARYASEESDDKKNIGKLLLNLTGKIDRQAQFRTVISLILKGKQFQFEGICKGNILTGETGLNGFGYDAVFKPDGSEKGFGEMTMQEKSKFSHRKKALVKLIDFLKEYNGQN